MKYHALRTDLLLEMSPLRADVYIRLGDDRYLKLFKSGDVFDESDLDKYRDKKGVEQLYILEDEIRQFLGQLNERVEGMAQAAANLSPDEVGRSSTHIHETIHALADTLGFTQELQDLTRNQVKMNVNAMRMDWSLKRIGNLLKKQGGYIADHSLLLSYFSSLIANNTEWGSEQTSYKLCFAAFLHDIKLKDQRLAEMRNMREVEAVKKEFDPDLVQNFRYHTIRGAECVKEFKEVPHDVDTIILQHHERPDGSGFPRGLKHHQITPLSAIFIVAHELIYYARKHEGKIDLDAFVREMEPYYIGNFEKVIEAAHLA